MDTVCMKLQPGSELRFDVPASGKQDTCVELQPESHQFAEMLGAEMAPGHKYQLYPGSSCSVFTWHGCSVKVENVAAGECYRADQNPMPDYALAHSWLEKMRRTAKEAKVEDGADPAIGPRVLVCGPPDSGKATLARMLVNYAARLDWQLTYADLDVSLNSIAVPGSIAAVPVDCPVPIDEGFSFFPPLCFHFGHTAIESNERLYGELVAKMGQIVRRRDAAEEVAQGGLVVKAMADGGRQDMRRLLHIIDSFDIRQVFVMGDDRLHAQLRQLRDSTELGSAASQRGKFTIHLLPKSGGCVNRGPERRKQLRDRALNVYFRGWEHTGMRLLSSNYCAKFKKLQLVRIGAVLPTQMEGILPIGDISALNPLEHSVVRPTKELVSLIVALSQANTPEEAATAPVYGFAQVQDVNEEEQTVSLLIPSPAKELLTSVLLIGEVRGPTA
eukprot:TRINITY_DN14358_c0_g1_i1.p1 TRINITY_DN14358_c0_g1~~TRINITY_DN14358_c0_g1_i1.p1  ORF type:complete len:444 (+),score=130.22 TRINITY_DN14358_c0_g1_i1:99-1430(+)